MRRFEKVSRLLKSDSKFFVGPQTYIYIAYYTSKSGIWLVISRVVSYFYEPEANANIAYE